MKSNTLPFDYTHEKKVRFTVPKQANRCTRVMSYGTVKLSAGWASWWFGRKADQIKQFHYEFLKIDFLDHSFRCRTFDSTYIPKEGEDCVFQYKATYDQLLRTVVHSGFLIVTPNKPTIDVVYSYFKRVTLSDNSRTLVIDERFDLPAVSDSDRIYLHDLERADPGRGWSLTSGQPSFVSYDDHSVLNDRTCWVRGEEVVFADEPVMVQGGEAK